MVTPVVAERRSRLDRLAAALVGGQIALVAVVAVVFVALRNDGDATAPLLVSIGALAVVPLTTLVFWREVRRRRPPARAMLRQSDVDDLMATPDEWTWQVGTDGRFLFCSPVVSAMLGYSVDELLGNSVLSYVHHSDRSEVLERTLASAESREGWNGWRNRWRHRDGSFRWLESRAVLTFDDAGNVTGARGVERDVTAEVTANAAEAGGHAIETAKRERIESVLRDPDALRIAFQPIIDTTAEVIVGVEALSRFAGEPYRTPDVWFAEAAEVGMGVELELHAIDLALRCIADLPGQYLSINVSPSVLVADRLAELILGVDPSCERRIVVELTEHVTVEHYEVLRPAIDRLRSAGALLAVDDAGAGYSSFQHILELQPDYIKLDRSIVSGIDADPVRRALAGAVADFADEIGAVVIAEGVERSEELRMIRASGVSHVQGYLFGRPSALPLPPLPQIRDVSPLTAIVVDDDAVVRMLVTRLTRKAGFDVVGQAGNGRDALAQAGLLTPDLIVLDLAMPQVDGVTALPLLRRRLPDATIVVLSASETGASKTDLADLGADAFVLKDQAAWRLPEVLAELRGREASDR